MVQLWTGLIQLLELTLKFFYSYVHNYGVAIILLTIAMRLLLLPLTIKQTRAMYEMQKLQPKLKELQEKHKNDKEKLQQEIMKFYSENKVNPFGSCLPMLLQLPVMIALFHMLYQSKELKTAVFLGMNLSQAASLFPSKTFPWSEVSSWLGMASPYYLLILVVVISTYLPQKMMAQDAQQNRIMLFMTIFMAYIAWQLPAGVLIYWVTTNIWTMGQQYIQTLPRTGESNA